MRIVLTTLSIFAGLMLFVASAHAALYERRSFQGVVFDNGSPTDWFRPYNPDFQGNQTGLRLAQQRAVEALVYFGCNSWPQGERMDSELRRRMMGGMGFLTVPLSEHDAVDRRPIWSFVLTAHQVINDVEGGLERGRQYGRESSCNLYPNTLDIPGHSTDQFPNGIDIGMPGSLRLGEQAEHELREGIQSNPSRAYSDWATAPVPRSAFGFEASTQLRTTRPIPFYDGSNELLVELVSSGEITFFMVGMEPTTRKPMISENPSCNDEIAKSIMRYGGLVSSPARIMDQKCNSIQGFSGGAVVAYVEDAEAYNLSSDHFAIGVHCQGHDNRTYDRQAFDQPPSLDYGSEIMPSGTREDAQFALPSAFTPIAGELLAELKRH